MATNLIATSATGILTDKLGPIRSHLARGFTLIELLTVVLIISIIIGAGVLSVSVGDRSHAREQARRLISIMNALSDEAILTGRPYAMVWNQQSYRITPMCPNRDRAEDAPRWVCSNCPVCSHRDWAITLPRQWRLLLADGSDHDFSFAKDLTALPEDYEYLEDQERQRLQLRALVQLHATGLWQPSANIRIVFEDNQYLAFGWTATGRVHFGKSEVD